VTSSVNHVGWWQNSSKSVYFASQGKTRCVSCLI